MVTFVEWMIIMAESVAGKTQEGKAAKNLGIHKTMNRKGLNENGSIDGG